MKTGLKIVLTIVAFLILGVFQVALKGGDSSRPGAGGPIGIILLFAFIAGVTAIWKYNPDKKDDTPSNNENDKNELDKS